MTLYGFLLFFLAFSPSASALDFRSYPTPRADQECHPLDFRSTSQARNAEELLRKNNPDRSRPNYAGKYLLLKVPYMMETEWLIADCASGKFFRETLSGNAEFEPESALIRVTRDKTTRWMHWTGETFARFEEETETKSAENAKDRPVDSTDGILEKRYAGIFRQYPAKAEEKTCSSLDFRSYFRAQQASDQIRKRHPDLTRPNFAGSYLILEVELLFETLQLIADCRTGKFFPEFRSGKMVFRKDSGIALLIRKDSSPELLEWSAPDWIRRPDPTLKDATEVENELRGETARSLLSGMPNPLKKSRIEFKDLLCRIMPGNAPVTCSVEIDEPKAAEKKFTLIGEAAQRWLRVMERYGVRSGTPEAGWSMGVPRGFCSAASGSCSLFIR
jgi:hypothetical protein